MPLEDGRALLKELLEHVTRPEFCYRHEWQEGDLVIWDNRCVLHRATPFDTTRHRRFMQRTTVSGNPAEFACVGGYDKRRRGLLTRSYRLPALYLPGELVLRLAIIGHSAM